MGYQIEVASYPKPRKFANVFHLRFSFGRSKMYAKQVHFRFKCELLGLWGGVGGGGAAMMARSLSVKKGTGW